MDRLVQILEDAGIPVWRDTAQLWPGQDWRAQIRGAIAGDALAFLACFSHASLGRARSYQNEELIEATGQLRLRPHDVTWLVPVRFDDCQIPDRDIGGGRTLRSLHYASLFGHQYLQQAERLVQVIRQILGDAAEPARRPPPVARVGLAPEISVGGPDASDGEFDPPVRSVVYVEVSEPLDDLTACYVTDHDRGGTTDLGHAPFHISTSRWRIRSDFQLEIGPRRHHRLHRHPQRAQGAAVPVRRIRPCLRLARAQRRRVPPERLPPDQAGTAGRARC